MVKLSLSDEQREQLIQLEKCGRNHEERWHARVILDLGFGLTRPEVARRHARSISGVDKTLACFRLEGVSGLLSRRFFRRELKIGQVGIELLAEAMRQSPRALMPDQPKADRNLWTLGLLADYLELRTGRRISLETVRRHLIQVGWTTKSPKLSCHSPDPQYQEKMDAIARLRSQAQEADPSSPLVFHYDQARLERQPTLRRCYRPKGKHEPIPHPGEQQSHYLHGAVSYPDGQWYCRDLPRMTASCVVEFCQMLMEDFPQRPIWLIMDGAPAHRSIAFGEFLAANPRLKVQFQPTYAPWTNPVERIWQAMRPAATHCHTFAHLTEVIQAAMRWSDGLTNDPPRACRLAAFQPAEPS